jgi:signal transduction histidine kinase
MVMAEGLGRAIAENIARWKRWRPAPDADSLSTLTRNSFRKGAMPQFITGTPRRGKAARSYPFFPVPCRSLLVLALSATMVFGQAATNTPDRSRPLYSGGDYGLYGQRRLVGEPSLTSRAEWYFEITNRLGRWIWEVQTQDNQTVRFWKAFTIPAHRKMESATLRITVDNGYTLFLDGKVVGGGYDWRTLKVYDMERWLTPGRHVLAVEAHNDRLQAGLICSLWIVYKDHTSTTIISGDDWLITPVTNANWAGAKLDVSLCHPAHVLDTSAYAPAWQSNWPYGAVLAPVLRQEQPHFWQRGWFQLTLSIACLSAVSYSLAQMFQLSTQAKARNLLQLERARIARDVHDDLSAQLTQVVLLTEVAQREHPRDSAAFAQFAEVCTRVREVATAMNEVVWMVNSRRDTVQDFVMYVCKYAGLCFNATSTRCRLDVEPVDIPPQPFELPVRRNLFLAIKEALHNVAKHSQADEVFLRIRWQAAQLVVSVEDNGRGFEPARAPKDRNGMSNMAQRMADIGGTFSITSQPGMGCLAVFSVSLSEKRRRWFQAGAPRINEGRAQ